MDENPVLVDLREGYRVVTLNRPQRLNAFTQSMHVALAAALALLAEPVAAEQAEQWGLIWKVFDDATLMGEAEGLCARLARGPTVGLALTKRALDAAEINDLATQLDLERDLQREAGTTPDF